MHSRFLVLIATAAVTLLWPPEAWTQRPSAGGAGRDTTPSTRMGTIRGQLRLADGSPASLGIAVTLSYREGGMVAQTQTDSSGKFSFQQIGPAIYRVQVRAPGYRDIETGDLDLNLNLMQYLNFELQPDPNYIGAPKAVTAMPVETVPRTAREFLESGQKLLESGSDYPKSIEWFKKAIKAYPKYSEAYLMMGLAYRAQHNLDDAGAALRKCIELNPNSAPAYAALGEVQNQKQEYTEAEKSLQKAVALNPTAAPSQVELARAYWALGRWPEAEPHVAKALAVSPDDASAHLIMGNIQLRKRDGAAALQQFREYLRLDPQGSMAPSVRDMVGKLEKALASSNPPKP
jgi:tetratricopeptide (TPR) repeat protein